MIAIDKIVAAAVSVLCITGIPGVSELVRAEYEVHWSSGNQFAFNEEDRLRKCV